MAMATICDHYYVICSWCESLLLGAHITLSFIISGNLLLDLLAFLTILTVLRVVSLITFSANMFICDVDLVIYCAICIICCGIRITFRGLLKLIFTSILSTHSLTSIFLAVACLKNVLLRDHAISCQAELS